MRARILSQFTLLSLIAAMGVLYWATLANPSQDMLLSGAALALIALSLGMERLFPLHQDWNADQGDTKGDIASFVLVFGALDSVLKFLSPFLVFALLPNMTTGLELPLWQQIILATLIIEFGAWLGHWAHHRYPRLWALHAMHHSTERLYTLNNFRFHPLNQIFTHLIAFVPPLLIGISPTALLGYAALSMPILLLQHSNVRFDFGILDHVFNTNALHRWHHSTAPREGTKNLGRALVIWDQVFGTYYNPTEANEPAQIGLFSGSKAYPRASKFWAQIVWPFNPSCCRAS